MTQKRARKNSPDIAILGGPTQDGRGTQLLRIREGTLSAGEIRPVKEGQPIGQSEIVRLKPIDAERRVCEVEVMHGPNDSTEQSERQPPANGEAASARQAQPDTQAPSRRARVSTDSYRRNWTTIFDNKKKTLN